MGTGTPDLSIWTEKRLRFAIEGRKRVKDQLLRIDSTYGSVRFCYSDSTGKTKAVTTLEEEEYPHYYHKTVAEGDEESGREAVQEPEKAPASPKAPLQEKHVTFQENQKGVSCFLVKGEKGPPPEHDRPAGVIAPARNCSLIEIVLVPEPIFCPR